MSRETAIARASAHFDDGDFARTLSRRVAMPTESQNPERGEDLSRYLTEEIGPELDALGFTCRIVEHPRAKGPFLLAERVEDDALPTVLGYGHGDVIRGLDERWTKGEGPWRMADEGDRFYGRGVVDNKGQHAINLAGMRAVLETRGHLGFNAKYLIEMGEECGSPGLREICQENAEALSADLLIASDGPRLTLERPTVFLGSRGGVTFDLTLEPREGAHHSGNWGGLLSNPAIRLSHAIASLVGPTGQIRVPGLVPTHLPEPVREALRDCEVGGADGPEVEPWWGEPGLSPSERVFGWCSLEVLAFEAGTPATPVNAIPGRAWARMQLRFVVGVDHERVIEAVGEHLARQGLADVEVSASRDEIFKATRLDPADPWVGWALHSIEATTGKRPALLPNLGGSLPNDAFSEILGLRTIWVPHSYPGCSQHAPDEHLPKSIAREGLQIMAGLYWDLGDAAGRPSHD
ncbi:M20 peptidase family dipeptidase [Fulvimarina endophytica]|uniref:M20 peptidase family dipeptidase n=1 Tax=Fulvimarina endophytica TaxID=2293836 RepID=A0A371WYG4_9HYPH|nr:M20 family metallopeptidase [Fulvimarina endophytica]RFC62035.1 M20 peptidase family dipeptidase [Fulvimarina endophytica]